MDIKFVKVPTEYRLKIRNSATDFLAKKPKHLSLRSTLTVEFASPEKIRSLNKKYRKIDEPTDVLSFPIWKTIEEMPPEGLINLGDIVICPAETDIEKNLPFLIGHSLNHLLGIHH